MRLFIAEKPQLGKVIADALGGGQSRKGHIVCGTDVVTWCIGHLLELSPPEVLNPSYAKWNKEYLPMKLRPWQLRPIERTADQFNTVRSLILRADEIVHAGDPDDEGQLLVDEVLEYCQSTAPVKRVLINDLNTAAARKALGNLRDNKEFRGMYLKALARSVADFIYGLNMTRAYTIAGSEKGLQGVLSIGRVQTPVLWLIVIRWLANKNHAAAVYYDISGNMVFNGTTVNAKLVAPKDRGWQLDTRSRLTDTNIAKSIAEHCKGKTVSVVSSVVEPKTALAPLPFSLLNLQVEMGDRYGISADETMKITQNLRDTYKAITYNRSDCTYLSSEQFAEAPNLVRALFSRNTQYSAAAQDIDTGIRGQAFNDAEIGAHTGIIPTTSVPGIDALKENERRVYDAIVWRYLAQFMPPRHFEVRTILFTCENLSFITRASRTTSRGWTTWLKPAASEQQQEATQANFDTLTSMQVGTQGTCCSIEVEAEKTKPPALYTESTLLKDLQRIARYVRDPRIKSILVGRDAGKKDEHGGIGTPATRTEMLNKLEKRGYYRIEKRKLIPTELGITLIQQLPDIVRTPDMTALWHEQQLMIEKGELSVDAFLDDIESFVATQVNKATASGISAAIWRCECGGHYRRCKGEKGIFWSCSNYPNCRNTAPDKNGEPYLFTLSANCPACRSKLTARPKAISCSKCDFHLFREAFHKTLTENQVNALLTNGKTGLVKGLQKKNGEKFEAVLVLNKTTWKIEPSFPAKRKPANK
ncbi:DNA topoisomerase 3 [Salmonella enterica]|nr:DNA topoisomerase 3 [Salmonella enterica]